MCGTVRGMDGQIEGWMGNRTECSDNSKGEGKERDGKERDGREVEEWERDIYNVYMGVPEPGGYLVVNSFGLWRRRWGKKERREKDINGEC